MTQFQKRIILAVAIGLALISTALAVAGSMSRPVAAIATEPMAYEYKYLVGHFQGFVAVFVAGEAEPAYITETRVATLPAADRDMLSAGIEIHTEEELSAILEDYGT